MSIDDDWKTLPDPDEFFRKTSEFAENIYGKDDRLYIKFIAQAYSYGYMAAKYGEKWYNYPPDELIFEACDIEYSLMRYLKKGGNIGGYRPFEEELT